MANLPEVSNFDTGVYQIEVTDPVEGGADGVDNKSARNLTNRTRFLKDEVTRIDAVDAGQNINISALLALAAKYFPKNRGYFTGLNVGGGSAGDTFGTAYDCSSAVLQASEPGNSVINVTMLNAMPNTNYSVDISLESLGNILLDDDCTCPAWKPISTTVFQMALADTGGGTQNLKVHFKVTPLS